MEYESCHETASRLHVNVRTVQKWAKEGRIPGARRMGKNWMIPLGIKGPGEEILAHQVIMPFLNDAFSPGQALTSIGCLANEAERDVAKGEYYYFTGQPDKAIEMVEPYLYHQDVGIALSACVVYVFSALSMGEVETKIRGIEEKTLDANKRMMAMMNTPELGDYATTAALFQNAITVMMHLPLEIKGELKYEMKYLPEGLKLFGAYTIAHHLYLQHEYDRALGTAETALLMVSDSYPVARIYLKLMIAAILMELRRIDDAKDAFAEAWELARDDQFIEPFANHFSLLHGLVETCLRRTEPEALHSILRAVRRFNKGWSVYHGKAAQQALANSLTPTEYSVAMMYHKAWSVKEIAANMEISERMVKHHLSTIYEKLGVSSRDELREYMSV